MATIDLASSQIFQALDRELSWIGAKWQVFRQLYMGKKEDFELLSRMSPTLFRILQDSLIDDLILSFSRLTDPPSTKRGKETRQNLTFEQLLAEIGSADGPILTKLRSILQQLNVTCEAMREQRNRRIAHTDLNTKLDISPLPTVTAKTIEDAFKLSSDFMNTASIELRDVQIGFHHVILDDDGDTLLLHLRMAEAYSKHLDAGRVDAFDDGVMRRP